LDMAEDEAVAGLGALGLQRMTEIARTDMRDLRVVYDNWFTERSLYENGQFDHAMALLRESGYLTERDGATWFKSSALGDEDDKVMVRSTGAPTYFATDIAYHYNKFLERGFDRVVDVLGADHQGHVRFMGTVPTALGVDTEKLDLIIYQLVTLKRGDEVVRASKRTGDLVTLRELVDEVG
ncbi:MAG: arginine--tRNA ligase, partial [Dehalococcoidia bacterium]|nr:arginine--tRNA ligase [Dehalococcoidia bacterium]